MQVTKTDLNAADIDRHVGERIRRRRVMLGLTQEQLGEALGISYQQIQKYETGANRVSAGRLFMISQILETGVSNLFDGLGEATDDDIVNTSRHVIELVRAFSKISDDKVRGSVMSLVRTLSDRESSEDVSGRETELQINEAQNPYAN